MLERQIMFKHLQELQRKQQLQDLGNNRNQNCVNQLSGGQYSPTHNEIPVRDSSQMLMVGNMQMLQHGEPNGLVPSQNYNISPQFDMSSYDTHAPNSYDNLNRYSQLQGSSNLLVNPLAKNHPAFGSSILSQRNFSNDTVSSQRGNIFGEIPAGEINCGLLSANYSQQGLQKNGSFPESRKDNENAASLDPLEQKILYNADDNSWESAFGRVGKMKSGGYESKLETPSSQSGRWSALMQSAMAETSSSDAGIQEEWIGLSFQNPEPLTNTKKLQSDWVDRNLQNLQNLSSSSKPEKNLFQNMNSFSNFQQSNLYTKQFEEYPPNSSHATIQHSPRSKNYLVDNKPRQLFQGSLPSENLCSGEQNETSNNDADNPNIFPSANDNLPSNNFSGHEFGGSFWLCGKPIGPVSSMQNKYDQVNQRKNDRYSLEPENMAHVGVSSGESLTAPSESMFELLNKDDNSHDQTHEMQQSSKVPSHGESPNTLDFVFRMGPTDHPQIPQSYSYPPSFSGNSSTTSPNIMSNYMKNMHPQSVSNPRSTRSPSYSDVAPRGYSDLKISHSSCLEFPILKSMPESKPSLTPDMLQHSGFPIGLPTPWAENRNSFRHEYQQPEKGKSAQEGSAEIYSSTTISRNIHHLEANAVESDLLLTNQHNQASNQGESKKGTPLHARDIGDFCPSLNQNNSPLHQPLSMKIAEADFVNNQHSIANARNFSSEHQSGVVGSQPLSMKNAEADFVNNQHLIANARKLSSEHQSGVKDSQVGAVGPGKVSVNNQHSIANARNLSSEQQSGVKGSQSLSMKNAEADFVNNQHSIANARKLSSEHQSGVKDSQVAAVGSGIASSMSYNKNPQPSDNKSHISPQMVPSWFKHNETMNGQILPMYDARDPANAAQSFSEVTLGNLRESRLISQVNVTNASQIGGVCLSTAATSMACKQGNSPCASPSNATYGNLAVSVPKKRKLAALDMVPWHKEIILEGGRLQDISTAEYLWTEASNTKPEEANNDAEFVEGLSPVTRAKRRLVSTTQLMQQVFQPLPVFILCSDATPNCDSVPYFAARLALGDAWSLTGHLPSVNNNISPDEIKASKRTKASKFSKVVESLINRVNKVESDLSGLDKSLSFVDLKVEAPDLENFSTINRFAKFHMRTHSANRDYPSSTALLRNVQKYVVAVPMPEIVPEGEDCVSL